MVMNEVHVVLLPVLFCGKCTSDVTRNFKLFDLGKGNLRYNVKGTGNTHILNF